VAACGKTHNGERRGECLGLVRRCRLVVGPWHCRPAHATGAWAHSGLTSVDRPPEGGANRMSCISRSVLLLYPLMLKPAGSTVGSRSRRILPPSHHARTGGARSPSPEKSSSLNCNGETNFPGRFGAGLGGSKSGRGGGGFTLACRSSDSGPICRSPIISGIRGIIHTPVRYTRSRQGACTVIPTISRYQLSSPHPVRSTREELSAHGACIPHYSKVYTSRSALRQTNFALFLAVRCRRDGLVVWHITCYGGRSTAGRAGTAGGV